MTLKAYVGTYADEVICIEIDTAEERFGLQQKAAKLTAPSYCAAADGKYLIVCSEVERFDGKYGGGLVSYKLEDKKLQNGKADGGALLDEISRAGTGGAVTCHVAYDPVNRLVAAANYGDGSFSVCTIDDGGKLSEPQFFVRHKGSGPDRSRQTGPHAHQCIFAGDGTLWVCDLGLDAAIQYALSENGALELRRLHTPPGSGARHMVFDKTGRYAYVLCEMASIIAVFDLDVRNEDKPVGIYSLISESGGQTGAAAIRFRSDDRLILATNRFLDSIFLYVADGAVLKLLDSVRCGKIPRDAVFVPGTDLVLAGYQEESRAALFDISNRKFRLVDETPVSRPTCFAFI